MRSLFVKIGSFFIFNLLWIHSAWGSYELGLQAFNYSDNFTVATATTKGETFWQTHLLFTPGTAKRVYLGWSLSGLSTTESGTSTVTFSTSDMGPKVLFALDKNQTWTLGIAYNLVATAAYSSGSTSEKWKGTSLHADLSVMPEVAEGLYAGFKLNYYSMTYTQATVGSTTSDVSYSRSQIFPTLAIRWLP